MGKVISFAGTKGGILKSTLTQCISTSKAFEKFKIAILEGDSQNSLLAWMNERDDILKPLNIVIISHDEGKSLKDEIFEFRENYDYLFLDLPGESKALNLTRTALAYSDLCIFPLRLSHKDTTAFDTNMRQPLKKVLEMRDSQHFRILPILAHHSTNTASFKENYNTINIIEKFNNIHRDRSVYTYFSVGGLTLREYEETRKLNQTEANKSSKAVEDIELIAEEILQTINN